MEPISFEEMNVIYAEHQPEYRPLPAYKNLDGDVVSCWKLSDEEKKLIQQTGTIYLTVKTLNYPLQPVALSVETPFESLE